jgi:hypothetical protein
VPGVSFKSSEYQSLYFCLGDNILYPWMPWQEIIILLAEMELDALHLEYLECHK